jgi:hypothetical protein
MVRSFLVAVSVSAALVLGAAAAPDPEEEFLPLFDGMSLDGWKDVSGQAPSVGWEVLDGAIHRRAAKAGNLVTDKEFANFDLRFEWKITKGGNSGLKYRTFPVPKKGLLGCEFQLLDDDNHPNGKKDTTRCGALYDLYAPDEHDKLLKPVGEFNTARVVAQGTHLEHWLNGKKVLDVDTASDDWKARIAKSKFKSLPEFAREKPGPILIQDHNNEVWFRNLRIRPLPSRTSAE